MGCVRVCSCSGRVLGAQCGSLRGSASHGARPGWGAWMAQRGPTAWPPAQPGSIWVASGRSAAEPAAATLSQDPPLPTPHTLAGKPLHTPSGPPPGPSAAPARACMGPTVSVRTPASGLCTQALQGSRRALTQSLEVRLLHGWADWEQSRPPRCMGPASSPTATRTHACAHTVGLTRYSEWAQRL